MHLLHLFVNIAYRGLERTNHQVDSDNVAAPRVATQTGKTIHDVQDPKRSTVIWIRDLLYLFATYFTVIWI